MEPDQAPLLNGGGVDGAESIRAKEDAQAGARTAAIAAAASAAAAAAGPATPSKGAEPERVAASPSEPASPVFEAPHPGPAEAPGGEGQKGTRKRRISDLVQWPLSKLLVTVGLFSYPLCWWCTCSSKGLLMPRPHHPCYTYTGMRGARSP